MISRASDIDKEPQKCTLYFSSLSLFYIRTHLRPMDEKANQDEG